MKTTIFVAIAIVLVAAIYFAPAAEAQEQPLSFGIVDMILKLIGSIIRGTIGVISGVIQTAGTVAGEITKLVVIQIPKTITHLLTSISKAIASAASETIGNALTSLAELIQGQIEVIQRLLEELVGREGALQQALKDIEYNLKNATQVLEDLAKRCITKIPLQVLDILRKSTAELGRCATGTLEVVKIELEVVRTVVSEFQGLAEGILEGIENCLVNRPTAEICIRNLTEPVEYALKGIIDALNPNNTITPGLETVQNCIAGVINVAESELSC